MSQTTAARSRRGRRTWVPVVGCSLVLVGFVGWWRGWFAGEPTCRGKTVTQWLDSMALFDEERNAERTGQNTFRYQRSPEVIMNDPALRALLHIGSNAVPVLVKRLAEPPQWSWTVGPIRRLGMWAEWKWYQLRSSGPAPPRPAPTYRYGFQRARNMAAAMALVALGTNGNAGIPRLLEAWAISPLDAANNRDVSPYIALEIANSGLPHRRAEMIAGVMAAMHHTDAVIRSAAANLTRTFPDEVSLWKKMLLKMTEDQDAKVRQAALWALVTENRDDPDVLGLLEETLKDNANPTRLRGAAAAGLGLAGAKATGSLALLREALNDNDPSLRSEARTAIRNIEKAAADDKARSPE